MTVPIFYRTITRLFRTLAQPASLAWLYQWSLLRFFLIVYRIIELIFVLRAKNTPPTSQYYISLLGFDRTACHTATLHPSTTRSSSITVSRLSPPVVLHCHFLEQPCIKAKCPASDYNINSHPSSLYIMSCTPTYRTLLQRATTTSQYHIPPFRYNCIIFHAVLSHQAYYVRWTTHCCISFL